MTIYEQVYIISAIVYRLKQTYETNFYTTDF